ncbi:scavenger receptor cysteine-rich domain-containing protein DMBT1-like [Mytilus edulis]|uniref:scavenger receptor cysteine-rich domain-containing protein DMBT1-like n=1 Tax=Mytilus edulis TaxID=6550 RepID=UPI0039EEE514
MNLLNIFSFLFVFTFTVYLCDIRMGTFIEHLYRNSEVIIAYNNMGLKMCGRYCLHLKSCTAVNYNSVSLLCELLGETSTDTNTTMKDFRYSAIHTWSLTDDACYPNPCSGRERCVRTTTEAYVCLTISTPCDDVICQNGGTCKNGPSTFTCQCVEGFNGTFCEASPCDDVICLNSGTCKNGPSTFTCQCVNGYIGTFCEEEFLKVRLVNGVDSLEGRVEIYINGTWGTICDDEFGDEEASVICGMLGYNETGSVPYTRAYFGEGYGSIVLDDLNCIGTETDIFDCQSGGLFQHNCVHSEDAGVVCQEDFMEVRLVDGNNSLEGRVEIYVNGIWGTICDDGFGDEEASVICGMLGYHNAGSVPYSKAHFGEGYGSIVLDDLNCIGTETDIFDCQSDGLFQHNCRHSEDAGVACQEEFVKVRLVNGVNSLEGRVEIYVNETWGTICDDEFGDEEASVICGMLGYYEAGSVPYSDAHFGEGYGSIVLDDLNCIGTEADIFYCQSNGLFQHDCDHSEDAGVVCQEDFMKVRLVDGYHSLEGRVEIYVNGTWGTICDDEFGDEEASVICGMLGCYDAGSVPYSGAYFGEGYGSIVLDDLNCIGIETNIFDCQSGGLFQHDCEHSEDAGVVCQGR